jgi:hypothetical protein
VVTRGQVADNEHDAVQAGPATRDDAKARLPVGRSFRSLKESHAGDHATLAISPGRRRDEIRGARRRIS